MRGRGGLEDEKRRGARFIWFLDESTWRADYLELRTSVRTGNAPGNWLELLTRIDGPRVWGSVLSNET